MGQHDVVLKAASLHLHKGMPNCQECDCTKHKKMINIY